MGDRAERIAANLARVRERIAAAAARSGRAADTVRLVAITKYVDAATARLLAEAGCLDLGESRPQELWRKAESLAELPIRWHQVGHLQRNKAKRTAPRIHMLHSGDSLRLLETLDAVCREQGRRLPVLLEVNVSAESAKHGFAPEEMETVLERAARFANLQIQGLMTMAALEGGRERARRDFARLRQLRDRLAAAAPEGVSLAELSMGMSGDFEEAIAEGATIVRVGSALFEGIAS